MKTVSLSSNFAAALEQHSFNVHMDDERFDDAQEQLPSCACCEREIIGRAMIEREVTDLDCEGYWLDSYEVLLCIHCNGKSDAEVVRDMAVRHDHCERQMRARRSEMRSQLMQAQLNRPDLNWDYITAAAARYGVYI